jgi:kynurenine 3-monooxygenase
VSGVRRVLIVGAGLAGSLLAIYLARRGLRVGVFERRSDPRIKGYAGGRSINLALSARGFWGLAGAGLEDRVREHDAIAMPGRMLHDPAGRTTFQPYSKNPTDAIHSVSRSGLNLTLIEAAARTPGVDLFFDHLCEDIDPDTPAALFRTPDGQLTRVDTDVLLGADGAFSAVRLRLQRMDRFEYSQSYLEHGYKELHIPPESGRMPGEGIPAGEHAARWVQTERRLGVAFRMDPHALHIWPRGSSMMIALPNRDGSFTCTLFWPHEGPRSFAAIAPTDIRAFFGHEYPDALPLMPTLERDYARNPVGSLVTVRCRPWQHAGRVGIIGDAAHAIVPFYGQGMNCAFQDVRMLAELLDAHAGSFADALHEFERQRKPDADAIADMAIDNFIEMRDLAGREDFQYAKRIERTLHDALGEDMVPQYNLVSFSTVSYAKARAQGRRIEAIVREIVKHVPSSTLAAVGEAEWTRRVIAAARPLATAEHRGSSEVPLTGTSERRIPGTSPTVIDITPAVTRSLAVWPGDTPPSREVLLDIARGDSVTLSTLRTTVHVGAHADAPNHYALNAPGIDERDLHYYLGSCVVLNARIAPAQRVEVRHIDGGISAVTRDTPRVLIRTGTFPDPNAWTNDFAALSVELIDALASRGVFTIGIDTPSVDLRNSKELPAHKAILRHDMAILEGLDLSRVVAGRYDLIALPLKLLGFDASPVRAVLLRAE